MIDINVAYMKIITEKSKINLDRSEISIDVVCHSMGCRALLLNLFYNNKLKLFDHRFDNIILLAPFINGLFTNKRW